MGKGNNRISKTTRTMKYFLLVLSLLAIVALVASVYHWVVILNGYESKKEKESWEELWKNLHDKQRTSK